MSDPTDELAGIISRQRAEMFGSDPSDPLSEWEVRDGEGPLTRAEHLFAATYLDGFDAAECLRHSREVSARGLVVGMAPGPRTSAALPMFPHPAGSAGGRLLAMSGMPVSAYLGRLERTNLCRGAFDPRAAARRAVALYRDHRRADHPRPRVVMCGRRVVEAFWPGNPTLRWFEPFAEGGLEWAAIPHPSGRCREYNDPANRERAGEVVRWAARWTGRDYGTEER